MMRAKEIHFEIVIQHTDNAVKLHPIPVDHSYVEVEFEQITQSLNYLEVDAEIGPVEISIGTQFDPVEDVENEGATIAITAGPVSAQALLTDEGVSIDFGPQLEGGCTFLCRQRVLSICWTKRQCYNKHRQWAWIVCRCYGVGSRVSW